MRLLASLTALLALMFALPASAQVMIGAWINTTGGGGVECAHEIPQIAGFDAQVGGSPAILHCYTDFTAPFPETYIDAIEASGSVAMLDWKCDQLTDINSGADDAIITAMAQGAAAHGKAIYLRWYYEMNQAWPGCGADKDPAGYIAAFRRIHDIFVAQGATNVSFVWCPAHTSSVNTPRWYPGDDVVDVIGVDGYDTAGTGLSAAYLFSPFFKTWATTTKPIFICETGAQGEVDQADYLTGLAKFIHNHPQIQAMIYFSSKGTMPHDWVLTTGVPAYSAMLASPPK